MNNLENLKYVRCLWRWNIICKASSYFFHYMFYMVTKVWLGDIFHSLKEFKKKNKKKEKKIFCIVLACLFSSSFVIAGKENDHSRVALMQISLFYLLQGSFMWKTCLSHFL